MSRWKCTIRLHQGLRVIPLRNSTVGLMALIDLMAKASLLCSQLEAEAFDFFQRFVSHFCSLQSPGTPPYICLDHSSLLPMALQKVYKKYFMPGQKHKQILPVSVFLREWHDRNSTTTEFRNLPHGNDSCVFEVIGSLALLGYPRSTWGISLCLSEPPKAVQPQYCTAALTGSAEKLKPETARP